MRLVRLEVQNYRSLFADDPSGPLCLELADGMSCIVGPNNCGKSNVLRALAVALDPDASVDRSKDVPGPLRGAKPTITLTFQIAAGRRTSSEKTLLAHLEAYEQAANPKVRQTYASQGLVRYRATIESGDDPRGTRRVTFVASGAGARTLPSDDELARKALRQFERCFHFVLVESGQSLTSLLEGKFRDILRSVLREQLAEAYAQAETHRVEYMHKVQGGLLKPLTERICFELQDLFPEITAVELRPDVGTLEETLTRMRIDVTDLIISDLAEKGTGVRGGILVAILRHLADEGRRSMLFAVEEPEAFLHPAAQELLREDLEQLSARPNVSLLVTTHSPFIVSRLPGSKVFAFDKDSRGRTSLIAAAGGADQHAGVLGGLFRDRLIIDVLDRAWAVPATAAGIIVVEGDTDERYLRLAVSAAGRNDLLDDVAIVQAGTGVAGAHAGGAHLAAMQALVSRATARVPVLALFDNDPPGREARDLLSQVGKKNNEWKVGLNLLTYDCVFPTNDKHFEFEAEDLWPNPLLERFLKHNGEPGFLKGKRERPKTTGGWQYDLQAAVKGQFLEFLEQEVQPEDAAIWVRLVERARQGLGLQPL